MVAVHEVRWFPDGEKNATCAHCWHTHPMHRGGLAIMEICCHCGSTSCVSRTAPAQAPQQHGPHAPR